MAGRKKHGLRRGRQDGRRRRQTDRETERARSQPRRSPRTISSLETEWSKHTSGEWLSLHIPFPSGLHAPASPLGPVRPARSGSPPLSIPLPLRESKHPSGLRALARNAQHPWAAQLYLPTYPPTCVGLHTPLGACLGHLASHHLPHHCSRQTDECHTRVGLPAMRKKQNGTRTRPQLAPHPQVDTARAQRSSGQDRAPIMGQKKVQRETP